MMHAEEQILIVHSVNGTPAEHVRNAEEAVKSYRRSASFIPVVTRPLAFPIPSGSGPGATLGGELTVQLQKSVGAIVFVDDLRPNIAYELGFFHGRGRAVLLITSTPVETVWKSISDLAGCALLRIPKNPIDSGIHDYLDYLYASLAAVAPFRATSLPTSSRNMIAELATRAQIPVRVHQSDFGDAFDVETWGGIIFDVWRNLLPEARFKIAIRTKTFQSTYSLYFRVRFPDADGQRRAVFLGLTSNRATIGFEGNERNLPAQPLTGGWQFLTGSFVELLRAGQVLGVQRVEALELIRVRAGEFQEDPLAKVPGYEIGFMEITGFDS